MLAKVKPAVVIDRWRVEGRTVIHKSWAGYTWRKKGSDLAYTAGCRFGPPPPPPPPIPVVAYLLEVYRTPYPYRYFFVTVRRLEDEVQTDIHTFVGVNNYLGLAPTFDSKTVEILTAERYRALIRIRIGPALVFVPIDVPPYNGQSPPSGVELIHTQVDSVP
jgi:hypothetical protein